MSIKAIYDKESEEVKAMSSEAHASFSEQLNKIREELNMSVNEMTNRAGAGPAMTSRVNNPDENITLTTMCRYASAVDKKVVVTIEDID